MSGEMIQLNVVGVQGKKTPVIVNKATTIRELFGLVSQKCGLSVNADELRLIYQGEELSYEDNRSIKDYDIQHNSQLFMVVRVRGGQFTR